MAKYAGKAKKGAPGKVKKRQANISENRFRAILDDQSYFIVRWKRGGIITYVNKHYCEYFNSTSEKLLGTSFYDLISPQDLKKMKARIKALNPKKPESKAIHQVILSNGEIRWHEWTDKGIFGDHGRLIEYQSTGQDITDLKIIELNLKESEKRFRDLFEGSPTAIVAIDPETNKFTIANPQAELLFGLSKKELYQYGPADLSPKIQPDRQASFVKEKQIIQQVTDGKADNFEWTHLNSKGKEIPCEIRQVKGKFEIDGKPLVIGNIIDITDRKQAEEALKLSEERFSKAFNANPDGAAITSLKDNRILEVNQSFTKIYGYTRDEAIGKTTVELGLWVDVKDRLELFAQLKSTGRVRDFIASFKTKSGSVGFVDVTTDLITLKDVPCALTVARDITRRREIEEALKLSEERFSKAFQTSPDSVTISTINDPHVVEVNNGFVKMTGYSKNEAIGKSLVSLGVINIKDRDKLYSLIEKDGKVRGLEVDFTAKSGKKRIADVSVDPITLNNEPCILTIGRDITEKKEAEMLLKSSEEKFSKAFQLSPELITINSAKDNKFLEINDGYVKTMGYTRDEVIGKTAIELGMWSNPDQRKTMIDQLKKEGKVRNFEIEFITKSGNKRIAELSVDRITLNNKPCLLTVGRDITERKQAEEKIASQEALYHTLVENIPDIIWTGNNEGQVTFLNKAWRDLTGREIEDSLGVRWAESVHPDDAPQLLAKWENAYKHGEPYAGECRFKSPDGSYRSFDFVGVPIHDETGKIISWMGIDKDITERKDAEKLLRQREKRLSTIYNNTNDYMGLFSVGKNQKLVCMSANRTILNSKDTSIEIKTEDDLIGKSHDYLLRVYFNHPPKEIKRRNAFAKEVINKKKEITFEGITKFSDGRVFYYEIDYIPVIDQKSKQCTHILTVSRDITSRKKAEEELMESEENLSAMINATSSPMLLTDEQGLIYNANMALCNNFNTTLDKLKGKNAFDFMPPEVAQKRKEKGGIVMKTKSPVRFTDSRHGKFFDNQIFPVLDKGGEISRLAIYAEDVTQRKQAEMALKEAYEEIKALKEQFQQENIYLQEEIKLANNYEDIIFGSRKFADLLNNLEQVAITDATVLILGETGTGKELIARAVHNVSKRSHRPLVKVNCAVLPKELIESELFGHEKGAFTGAISQKMGRFELAHKGSIFLDEIGELPLESQVKILRVIQEGEFERLGSNETRKVDVRLITATNRDLENEIKEGNFRSDLFYRLNVFPLVVPPLRERIEDISHLVYHFVNKYNPKFNKSIKIISDSTIKAFENYDWPGNVRELENMIERGMILSRDETLIVEGFSQKPLISSTKSSLRSVEREHIFKVLQEKKWKIHGEQGAAKMLDLAPSTLRDKLKKLGIRRPISDKP